MLSMGKYLKGKIAPPQVILSSTASRAFYTALHLCDFLDIDERNIKLTEALFHAGPQEILKVVQAAPECDILAIFGHNPGFTSAANSMGNMNIDNVPTTGVVGISFDVDTWPEVNFGKGKQEFFYYPKGI